MSRRAEYYDADGTFLRAEEIPDQPLDASGALATLLAVTGVLTVTDAANAVHLTPDALIAEAEAWAVAAEMRNE